MLINMQIGHRSRNGWHYLFFFPELSQRAASTELLVWTLCKVKDSSALMHPHQMAKMQTTGKLGLEKHTQMLKH